MNYALKPGRIVMYAFTNRASRITIRPAIITSVNGRGKPNLQVFLEPGDFPNYDSPLLFVPSARYSASTVPDTWNWTEYQRRQMENRMNRKFRKKPVVIEAFQLTVPVHAQKLLQFGNTGFLLPTELINGRAVTYTSDGAKVQTTEGVMRADFDDWIITGVNGEIYPCKPDVFEKTYEAVEE